jgi:hypothetical protein
VQKPLSHHNGNAPEERRPPLQRQTMDSEADLTVINKNLSFAASRSAAFIDPELPTSSSPGSVNSIFS